MKNSNRQCLRVVFAVCSLLMLLATSMCASGAAFPKSFPKNYQGTPYRDNRYQGGAQNIPGRVECAYYDSGGEGVAYHDTDSANKGSGTLNPADGTYLNQFRMDEGVDISYTKFHDEIDNNPYNKVVPRRISSMWGGPSPENGSTLPCTLLTPAFTRPISFTPQIAVAPFQWM